MSVSFLYYGIVFNRKGNFSYSPQVSYGIPIGKSIYEIAEMNNIELGPSSVGGAIEAIRSDTWTEPLYGEGPTTGYDHILIVGNGAETATPMTDIELKRLQDYWEEDEIFPESRLASQVQITPQMDGMTVYVPDRIVEDIP
jgi:hypothetical protein